MKLHLSGLLLLACALTACSKDDEAPTIVLPKPETFSASLTGANERPNPTTSTATGSATISVLGGVGTYTVTVSGLTGPVTASHIHGPADPTIAVGVIVPFTITNAAASGVIATGTFTGTNNPAITLDSLLVLLRNGRAYVNVHTAANPGGEIRGTVTKP
jgi:CHRD domain-containing protein